MNKFIQNTTCKLTEAQKRARDWLPADGAWRGNAGRFSAALNSLSIAWPGCVEMEWFGPCLGGGWKSRWRLTQNGVDLKESNT